MSKFGEPWARENSRPHVSHSRDMIYKADSTRVCDTRNDTETAKRIVACVNALANVPHPERIGALLEAAGRVEAEYEGYGAGNPPGDFWAALEMTCRAYRALMEDDDA